METRIVTVDLEGRGYDIYIGADLLSRIDDFLPDDIQGKKVFIITDKNAAPYAHAVQQQFQELGVSWCDTFILPPGEKTKSYASLKKIYDWVLVNEAERSSLIVAVGGGVIGDLAGHAAATILRGIPFIQIPTTLLSQVDSSVGGKTGINTPNGKNLVGSFYQPTLVLADSDTIKTLPPRHMRAGYAEIVKYGLLGDYEFFEWLEDFGTSVIEGDAGALGTAVEKSCRAKAKIVQADEREGGVRALLNLGHTFGHALEAAAGYSSTLLHGEAVAIGMVMAFDLSVRLGHCEQDDLERVRKHIQNVGLPVKPPAKLKTTVDNLMALMRRDKKVKDNKMTFILASTIGETFITQDVSEETVRSVLNDYI